MAVPLLFNNAITYTVDYFDDINNQELYGVYHYKPDLRRTIVYSYLAKAMNGSSVIDTKTYTITVQNNWSFGKNKLIRKVNEQ